MNPLIITEYDEIYKSLGGATEKLAGKSILITGATGLIGSYMTDFLIYMNREYSLDVDIFAMSTSMEKLNARFGCGVPHLHFIEHDLRMPFTDIGHFDYIIHAASPADPRIYLSDPVSVMRTNLIGTISLLDNAVKSKSRFLFLSSSEIYGPNTDGAFTENDPGTIDTKRPRSCYPESKRAAETLCISYAHQYGVPINIARMCYIYGPTITNTSAKADAEFLRNAIDGTDMVLRSHGLHRRTWCYVADAVAGLLHILLKTEPGVVYNVANTDCVATLREFALQLAKLAGVKVEFNNYDVSKPIDSVLSGDKLIATGWHPKYDLARGLRHTFEIKKSK